MIEFLFWEGCPSHERALAMVTDQMDELGIDRSDLIVREVLTSEDAKRERFVGSPTIRVDGADLTDPGDEPYGLECRLYYHRDGRPSPLPDAQDLKETLTAYARKGE